MCWQVGEDEEGGDPNGASSNEDSVRYKLSMSCCIPEHDNINVCWQGGQDEDDNLNGNDEDSVSYNLSMLYSWI